MTRFANQVQDPDGMSDNGVLTADETNDTFGIPVRDGRSVLPVQEQLPSRADARRARIGRGDVRRDDVIYFATQLAVMVDTGVPLPEALDTIALQTKHPAFRGVISDLCAQIRSGVEFSAALARYPRIFGNQFVALMRASEASGTMGMMLQRLSEYMAKEREIRKKIKGAMMYPLCMLSFCVLVLIGLLAFILPRFERIYDGKGAVLPTPTRVLLGFSSVIVAWWPLIVAGLAALSVAAWLYLRGPNGRIFIHRVRISLPFIGSMYRKGCLARSLRTMATMVKSGVSVLDGLEITAQAAGNHFYAQVWRDLAEQVKQGSDISEHLYSCKLMPQTVTQMIAAGERTGKLGMVMNRVADFCEDDLNTAVKTITNMIEPIMIVVMGLIVGGIAMALLLPVFSLSKMVAY